MGPASLASPRPRSAGFALIVTIVLVAFLVLILVGLATFTRVETQVATNTQSQAQARQNALFALNLALGQLQRHTGPDQRVTATADVQPMPTNATQDAASGVDLSPANAATVLDGIDAYWRAQRNRRWTGAWRDGNNAAFDPNDAPSINPQPELQAWLVSGNENNPATFSPGDIVTGLTATSSPLEPILDSAGRPHRLLVKNSAAADSAATLDRAVTAPQIPIIADNVPGQAGPATIGHYAWWVGDEGVKARAGLTDSRDTGSSSADSADNRIRRRSAQRPVIEAMATNGIGGLQPFYDPKHALLGRALTLTQLGFLNNDPVYHSRLRERFHDLTLHSRGVLADTRNGGLKRDLTHILGRPTLGDFRAALNGAGFSPAPAASHNPLISAASSPYAAAYPNILSGSTSYADIFTYSATWEQLWSYHRLGTGAALAPRLSTATQHGLHPMLVQGKLFYRLRIGPAAADADGVNRSGTVRVDILPMVVLANPYNVPIAPADYRLRFTDFSPSLRFGDWTDESSPPDLALFTPPASYTDLGNGYTGAIRLLLRNTEGLAPGEARIFSLDTDVAIPAGAAAQAGVEAILIDDYDPSTSLSFDTGQRIPADKTRAALYTAGSSMVAHLYLGDPVTANQIARVGSRRPSTESTVENPGAGFLVYPISDGLRQGGGAFFALIDGATSGVQQATFSQVNYRTHVIRPMGFLSDNQHPLQWARAFMKDGATGGTDSTPNPYLLAHFVRRPGSTNQVRWGLRNTGVGLFLDTAAPELLGDVGFVNVLYDVPAPGRELNSLGQLQHFNTIGHLTGITGTSNHGNATTVHAWQVNYPIGNSYPNPRVDRDRVFISKGHFGYHYDGSYLLNEILWDRFHFSSFPASGSFDFATQKLVNARYRPFRDPTLVPLDDETAFRGVYEPAKNLLVEGAFNINSTSVDAWRTVLSALKGVPTGTETAPSAPFARTLDRSGGSAGASAGNTENAWTGFRDLSPGEIDQLAREMVLHVRKRGPFLSLSQFVNRRLPPTPPRSSAHALFPLADDPLDLGLSGALQSALDKVINRPAVVPAPFNSVSTATANRPSGVGGTGPVLAEVAYRMPNVISGFPGYLLQGDVLSTIGDSLSARSDTFTIRTYGDATNPATGAVEARAWCEAVVQRLPDYVRPRSGSTGDNPEDVPTDASNIHFGRRYVVVSFRWLGPEDL